MSLVAVFGGVSVLPAILAYHFSIILRAVIYVLLLFYCSERSVLRITGSLSVFWLLATKLVTKEAFLFKSSRLPGLLWRRFLFSIVFDRNRLIEELRHGHLGKLNILQPSMRKSLYFIETKRPLGLSSLSPARLRSGAC